MMARRTANWNAWYRFAAAITLGVPAFGRAQGVEVHGVAYDSVRNQPLVGAFVGIVGNSRSATTDARGRFQFDGLTPGAYTFTLQHATLDSIGFSGLTARATVADKPVDLTIASPSFATIWRAMCGAGHPPSDSGIVYGTVNDAARQGAVAGATVELTWVVLKADKQSGVAQKLWRNQTRSDARGGYGACGVPLDVGLRVRASTDSAASGLIDLLPADLRVQRRDLVLGPTRGAEAARRGTIAGMVTHVGGSPAAGARVLTDEAPEVRTGADGRFTIPNVPAGTRQIEITFIGMAPLVLTVDVVARDTATVLAELRKVNTLAAVNITASAWRRNFDREFEDRRKSGFGYAMDSTKIGKRGTLLSVFAEFPSTEVRPIGRSRKFAILFQAGIGKCNAIVWLDGVRSDLDLVSDLTPDEIAMVEVYPHRYTVPGEFMLPGVTCGAVAVWTKRGMR